jgi:glyoxylase-like metal-dependent hydrolase (beta-lactamase superfamily II)
MPATGRFDRCSCVRIAALLLAAMLAAAPASAEDTCAGDVNGDGALDIDDIVAVVLAFGTSDPAADVDGSGTVDIDDLVQIVQYDLGGRVLDVIAIPGHQSASIALYDARTGLLLTGDTVYPGFLFITSFNECVQSIDRLVAFLEDKPLCWILGTHIEMTATPFVAYPYGTNYQPNERELQLNRAHLLELQQGVHDMQGNPFTEAHADFIIDPF